MTVLLAAAHLWAARGPLGAADFFPLSPGCTRTYFEPGGTTTEEVQDPIKVGDNTVYPIVQRDQGGRVFGTLFYRLDGNTVYLLGSGEQKNWLPQPLPVLRFDGQPGKWKYDGVTGGSAPQPISLSGECRVLREEDVFGKSLPVIQISLRSMLGQAPNQVINTSVAKYAAGVGMIEVTSSAQAARQRPHAVVRRLVKIEGGKSNG